MKTAENPCVVILWWRKMIDPLSLTLILELIRSMNSCSKTGDNSYQKDKMIDCSQMYAIIILEFLVVFVFEGSFPIYYADGNFHHTCH